MEDDELDALIEEGAVRGIGPLRGTGLTRPTLESAGKRTFKTSVRSFSLMIIDSILTNTANGFS